MRLSGEASKTAGDIPHDNTANTTCSVSIPLILLRRVLYASPSLSCGHMHGPVLTETVDTDLDDHFSY